MSQDPKKELKEIEKLSIKEKLKQYRPEKKASKEVGEMGKPSLKAEFEDAMQKQYKSRPENMKESFRSAVKEGVGEAIAGNLVSSAERLAGGAKRVMEKMSGSKTKLLKSMSKEPLKKLKSY